MQTQHISIPFTHAGAETFINVDFLYTIVNKNYTMLERLFTSKTRKGILSLLMFNQDSDFHLRDIARRIGVSPIYASAELKNLAKLNLVSASKKANLTLYRINRGSPILQELRQLFIKTDYFGETAKKFLGEGAKYAFIYGSFARGEETASSDIDMFVIGSIKEDELIRAVQKLEAETSREVNYILWDEKTLHERKGHPLLKKIKAEKILMLKGDENEFRKLI
jgi:predicted nucleotidyltransferase